MTDDRSLKEVYDEVQRAFDYNYNHFTADLHKWMRTAFDYFTHTLKQSKMITK